MPAPANDLYANATLLDGMGGTATGTTVASTLDVPFDVMGDALGSTDSVWYKVPIPPHFDIDTWSFSIAFSSPGDLAMVIWMMQPGSAFPPANSGDVNDVFFLFPTNSASLSLSPLPDDRMLYIGVGDESGGGDTFSFTWSFVQLPVLRYEDPPVWRLLLGASSGRILGLLDKRSTNRAFTFNLDEPWSHTGLVSSEDPEINIPFPDPTSPAYLTQNMRKIWGLRRENSTPPYDCGFDPCGPYVCRFSGIVMTLEDIGADTPTTRYTAYDSWQYLMSRPCRIPDTDGEIIGADGFTYVDARPSDIVQEQLLLTLDQDDEVWIDMDDAWVEDSDVLTGDFTISQGESVGEVWTRCCATGMMDIILLPIFDPLNRPGMLSELHIYKEAGTTRHNAVFGWSIGPHNVTELSRLVDGTQMANTVTMISGDGDSATQIDTDSQTDYGKYYSQQVISDATSGEHNLLNKLAFEELVKRTHGVITVEFQPAPEYSPLPLRDYFVGDWVPLWSDNRLREPITGWVVIP